MEERADNVMIDTNVLTSEASGNEEVERQLETTCLKLNETEINIRLFKKMVVGGVATNDVRNFAEKQALLKTMDNRVNLQLVKKAMKSKLADAYTLAHSLRRRKKALCDQMKTEFNYSRKYCRRVIKDTIEKAANHRLKHRLKAEKKFIHCEKRSTRTKDHNDFMDIPREAWQLLEGVNLFGNEELVSEESADPMVCCKDIPLSKAELSFLKRGPKYMLRQECDERDFKVELEKMTVKDKYNSLRVCPEDDLDQDESNDSLSEVAEKEEAKAAMVYVKSEKVLDLGKLKATEYKFNKHVFLPKNETADKEAMHEVRRAAMLDVFKKSVSKEGKRGVPGKIESNLTRSERAGMKSLQKRVQKN